MALNSTFWSSGPDVILSHWIWVGSQTCFFQVEYSKGDKIYVTSCTWLYGYMIILDGSNFLAGGSLSLFLSQWPGEASSCLGEPHLARIHRWPLAAKSSLQPLAMKPFLIKMQGTEFCPQSVRTWKWILPQSASRWECSPTNRLSEALQKTQLKHASLLTQRHHERVNACC